MVKLSFEFKEGLTIPSVSTKNGQLSLDIIKGISYTKPKDLLEAAIASCIGLGIQTFYNINNITNDIFGLTISIIRYSMDINNKSEYIKIESCLTDEKYNKDLIDIVTDCYISELIKLEKRIYFSKQSNPDNEVWIV